MKRAVLLLSIVALGGLAIGAGIIALRLPAATGAASTGPAVSTPPDRAGVPPVIATVQTALIQKKRISVSLVAYGTVVARGSSIRNVAVPFKAQVLRILVAGGQHVRKNESLLQLESTSSELLVLAQAQSGKISAQQQLDEVQQKFKLHLATRQSLLAARQALQLAQLQLTSLQALGIGGPRLIKAPASGVVAKILSGPGQITLPGAPLLQLVSSRNIEVQLGLEPEDSIRVRKGQSVALTPVGAHIAHPIIGKIALITQRVNPLTRLVDVFVTPQPRSGLLLGQYVQGKLIIASALGLVVPRAAVLPAGGNEQLFTVNHGRAILHLVHIGLANDRELQIIGKSISAGEPAVIVGNAELLNGMAVTGTFKP